MGNITRTLANNLTSNLGSGGGGGRGEVLLNSFDFSTDTWDHGVANNTRKGFSTTSTDMFTSTYPSIRVILEDVSTATSILGNSQFGFGAFIRKNGSTYPADHDLLNHGALMSLGRFNNNGSGGTNFNPNGAAFEMSSTTFYRLVHLDFVFSYSVALKQPSAMGTMVFEGGGRASDSGYYMTNASFGYNGLTNQVASGSWSGVADTFCIYNPADSTGTNPWNKGKAYIYGIPG